MDIVSAFPHVPSPQPRHATNGCKNVVRICCNATSCGCDCGCGCRYLLPFWRRTATRLTRARHSLEKVGLIHSARNLGVKSPSRTNPLGRAEERRNKSQAAVRTQPRKKKKEQKTPNYRLAGPNKTISSNRTAQGGRLKSSHRRRKKRRVLCGRCLSTHAEPC